MNRYKTPRNRADAALRKESKEVAHDTAPVHAWVKSVLEDSLASRNAYAFKSRTKPFNEIVAKVQAKRNHEDPAERHTDYGPSSLTDVSGFRIVSLFNDEIPTALGHLLDLLETLPTTADPRGTFLADPVEEIILFSSRREGDALSIDAKVEEIVREHGLQSKLKIKPLTYSSVHVIVRSRFAVQGGAPLIAASEIQLRSVFEEAWSEINHRLNYGPAKRARARRRPASLPSDENRVLLHLDALKSLTDGCAQYADLVNRELIARQASRDTRLPQPTDSAEELVRSFRTSDPAIYRIVEQAFARRAEATAAARDASQNPELGSSNHKRLFLDAARQFAEALQRVARDSGDAAHRTAHENVLQREVAFCYQFSGNAELRARAETIYEDLVNADPNNIDVLARLALIKRDEQDLSEARILMEDALDEEMQQAPSERPSQIRWMLCRNLSVLYLQIFEDDRESSDAAELLAGAVDLAERARNAAPTDRQRVGTSLYLLYYLAVQHARADDDAKAAIVRRAESLLPLDLTAEVPLERWLPAKLDTLLHVEAAFGTKQRAKEIASMIVQRLKPGSGKGSPWDPSEKLETLSAEDRNFYLFAVEVLAGV
jgi:ppGpp synthetase/RelA/SpoT-type nucleotidyltranferase